MVQNRGDTVLTILFLISIFLVTALGIVFGMAPVYQTVRGSPLVTSIVSSKLLLVLLRAIYIGSSLFLLIVCAIFRSWSTATRADTQIVSLRRSATLPVGSEFIGGSFVAYLTQTYSGCLFRDKAVIDRVLATGICCTSIAETLSCGSRARFVKIRGLLRSALEHPVRDVKKLRGFMAALDFTSSVAIPVFMWTFATFCGVLFDVAHGYPGTGAGLLVLAAGSLALFTQVEHSEVWFVNTATVSLYVVWLLGYGVWLTSADGGLAIDEIPEAERTLWYSPLTGNVPLAAAIVVSTVLSNHMLGYLVAGSAAETSVLAHSKQQKLLRVLRVGEKHRQELMQVVRDQVPPYAQHCMQKGIEAFQSANVVFVSIHLYPRGGSEGARERSRSTGVGRGPSGTSVGGAATTQDKAVDSAAIATPGYDGYWSDAAGGDPYRGESDSSTNSTSGLGNEPNAGVLGVGRSEHGGSMTGFDTQVPLEQLPDCIDDVMQRLNARAGASSSSQASPSNPAAELPVGNYSGADVSPSAYYQSEAAETAAKGYVSDGQASAHNERSLTDWQAGHRRSPGPVEVGRKALAQSIDSQKQSSSSQYPLSSSGLRDKGKGGSSQERKRPVPLVPAEKQLLSLDEGRLAAASVVQKVGALSRSSIWSGVVGCEIPQHGCGGDRPYDTADGSLNPGFYTGFSVAAAIRFGASVAKKLSDLDPSCYVSVGVALSSTAVFGLLGLQQSPQEWGAVSEGRTTAEHLAHRLRSGGGVILQYRAASALRSSMGRLNAMVSALDAVCKPKSGSDDVFHDLDRGLRDTSAPARGLSLRPGERRVVQACAIAAYRLRYAGSDKEVCLGKGVPSIRAVRLASGVRIERNYKYGSMDTSKKSAHASDGSSSSRRIHGSREHRSLNPASFASKTEVLDAQRVVALRDRLASMEELSYWMSAVMRACVGKIRTSKVDPGHRRSPNLGWVERLVGLRTSTIPATVPWNPDPASSSGHRSGSKALDTDSVYSPIQTELELLSCIAASRLPASLRGSQKFCGSECLWCRRSASVADKDTAEHDYHKQAADTRPTSIQPAILVSPVVFLCIGLIYAVDTVLQVAYAAVLNQAAVRAAADGVDTDMLASAGGIMALHLPLLAMSVLCVVVAWIQLCRGADLPLWVASGLLVSLVVTFSIGHFMRRTTAVGIICFNLGGVFHNSMNLGVASYLAAYVSHSTRSPGLVVLVAIACGLLTTNGTYSPLLFREMSGSSFLGQTLTQCAAVLPADAASRYNPDSGTSLIANATAPLGGLYVACFAFAASIRQLDTYWMASIALQTTRVAVRVQRETTRWARAAAQKILPGALVEYARAQISIFSTIGGSAEAEDVRISIEASPKDSYNSSKQGLSVKYKPAPTRVIVAKAPVVVAVRLSSLQRVASVAGPRVIFAALRKLGKVSEYAARAGKGRRVRMLEDGFVMAFGIERLSREDRNCIPGATMRYAVAVTALRAAAETAFYIQSEMARQRLGLNAIVSVATGHLSVGLYGHMPRIFGAIGNAIDVAIDYSNAWMQRHACTNGGLVVHPDVLALAAPVCPAVLGCLWAHPRVRLVGRKAEAAFNMTFVDECTTATQPAYVVQTGRLEALTDSSDDDGTAAAGSGGILHGNPDSVDIEVEEWAWGLFCRRKYEPSSGPSDSWLPTHLQEGMKQDTKLVLRDFFPRLTPGSRQAVIGILEVVIYASKMREPIRACGIDSVGVSLAMLLRPSQNRGRASDSSETRDIKLIELLSTDFGPNRSSSGAARVSGGSVEPVSSYWRTSDHSHLRLSDVAILSCFGIARRESYLAYVAAECPNGRQKVSFLKLGTSLHSSKTTGPQSRIQLGLLVSRLDSSLESYAMLHSNTHPTQWKWRPILSRSTIPNSISEFKPIRIVGEGAFGVVYQATHVATGLDVAIKAVQLGGSSTGQLQQEISSLHSVRKLPGVCGMLGCIVSATHLYLVMEMVHGETLQGMINQAKATLSTEATRVLAKQLASTIASMHRCGVLHRDIKPGNIVIEDQTGAAKLIDFGLAVEHWDTRSTIRHVSGYSAPTDIGWYYLKGRYSVGSLLQLCAPFNAERVPVSLATGPDAADQIETANHCKESLYIRSWEPSRFYEYRWKAVAKHLKASKLTGTPVLSDVYDSFLLSSGSVGTGASRSTRSQAAPLPVGAGGQARRAIPSKDPPESDSRRDGNGSTPYRAVQALNLKLLAVRSSPTVFCRPSATSIMAVLGRADPMVASLCCIAYVEIYKDEETTILRYGRKLYREESQRSSGSPYLFHILPRIGSEHTAGFYRRDEAAISLKSGRKRRLLKPFLDSMDGSKTASTSVVASLTNLSNSLAREPMLYDCVVLPNIRAIPSAVGAVDVVKRNIASVVPWVREMVKGLQNRGFSLFPVLFELWKRTLPDSMVRQVSFTSSTSENRYGADAWQTLAIQASPARKGVRAPEDSGGAATERRKSESAGMYLSARHGGSPEPASGAGAPKELILCDEMAFVLRSLLPQLAVVLGPGCPNDIRKGIYQACNATGELNVNVLHAYSTTTCVDQIVVRGCRMRAAAWQIFLTVVDASFSRWRRPMTVLHTGLVLDFPGARTASDHSHSDSISSSHYSSMPSKASESVGAQDDHGGAYSLHYDLRLSTTASSRDSRGESRRNIGGNDRVLAYTVPIAAHSRDAAKRAATATNDHQVNRTGGRPGLHYGINAIPGEHMPAARSDGTGRELHSDRGSAGGESFDDELTGTYDEDAGAIWVKDAPFAGAPAGTLHFLAPECLQHRGSSASDYWALGALLFRATSGELPLQPGSQTYLLYRVRHGYVRWRKLPASLPYVLVDLIRGLLEVDPSIRYGATYLAVHPFLAGEARGAGRNAGLYSPSEILKLFTKKAPLSQPASHVIRERSTYEPGHLDDRRAIYMIERVRTRLRSGLQPVISREMQSLLGSVDDVQTGAIRDLEIVDRRDRVKAALQLGTDGRSTGGSSVSSNRRSGRSASRSAGDYVDGGSEESPSVSRKDSDSSDPALEGMPKERVGALRGATSRKPRASLERPDIGMSYPEKVAAAFLQHRVKTVSKQVQLLKQRRQGLPSAVRDDFEGAGSASISVQDFPDGADELSREDAFLLAVAQEDDERRDRKKGKRRRSAIGQDADSPSARGIMPLAVAADARLRVPKAAAGEGGIDEAAPWAAGLGSVHSVYSSETDGQRRRTSEPLSDVAKASMKSERSRHDASESVLGLYPASIRARRGTDDWDVQRNEDGDTVNSVHLEDFAREEVDDEQYREIQLAGATTKPSAGRSASMETVQAGRQGASQSKERWGTPATTRAAVADLNYKHRVAVRRRLEAAMAPRHRRLGLDAVAGEGIVNRNTREGPRAAIKLSREALFVSPAGLMSAIAQLPSVAEIDEMAGGVEGAARADLEGSDSEEGSDGSDGEMSASRISTG